jgi:uncharacterized protein (TIGR00369 family)
VDRNEEQRGSGVQKKMKEYIAEILTVKKGQTENSLHRNCFACGSNNGIGLGLTFYKNEDGAVFGSFFADPKYEGYSGIIHGGIIATLLDSAMTHCLLVKDIPALTGRLSIKYSNPIQTGATVRVKAKIINQIHGVFILEGKALVDGKKVARAEAKYRTMKRMKRRVNQGAKK